MSFWFEYIPILVSRTLPERIARSREIAEAFVKTNLPGHIIKPVPGDWYCIIHGKVTFHWLQSNVWWSHNRPTKGTLIKEIPNISGRWCQYCEWAWAIPWRSSFSVRQSNHLSLSWCSWHGLQSKHQDLTKLLY